MEHILLKEIEEQIKEAKDASEAAKTTNERELILTQLNLLLQQKYVLLTRLFPPPPTTGTPSKSVFSCLTTSSPMLMKKDELMEKVENHLKACEALSIHLYFDKNKIDTAFNTTAFNADQIIEALSNLNCRDTEQLHEEMELGEIASSSGIDFKLDDLLVKSEKTFQNSTLTPIAEADSDILDTHLSNAIAQYLCVSPAINGKINFNTKPDLIHGKVPMMLEIKSRVTDGKTASISNKMGNISLSDHVPQTNITKVEIDLFQQCMERILEQAQFRAYLSKFVVLGSTGHTSWCFYYTQNFEGKGHSTKKLTISKITNADVNNVWNGMTDRVRSLGSAFYLSKHAPVITNTLQCLFPNIDLHSIRVNVAGNSQSVVYYVTPPDVANNKTVTTDKKAYAFKVVSDKSLFDREVEKLEKVKRVWERSIFNQRFYYITNSESIFSSQQTRAPITISGSKYSWLKASNENNNDNYYIIIMYPALRTRLRDVVDTNRNIYSELLRSLTMAHKAGVLHCDISPHNCLHFADGWQVVDYGLSIDIEKTDDWMIYHSGTVSIQKGSYQHRCCGQRAFEIISEYDHNEVEFDWTVGDDLEMLQIACSKQKL